MRKLFIFATALLGSFCSRAQITNGDMEEWRPVTLSIAPSAGIMLPQNWNSTDSLIFSALYVFPSANFSRQVYQSTNAHSGNFAAEIITKKQDTMGILPGVLTNTTPAIDMSLFTGANATEATYFTGGLPVTSRVSAVNAWLKYLPQGNDTAIFIVHPVLSGMASDGRDSVVGSGFVRIFGGDTSYNLVTANITYIDATVQPDYLQISFISGSKFVPIVGSKLFVDDVFLSATAVKTPDNHQISIHPNPNSGKFMIEAGEYSGLRTIDVYSLNGQKVFTAKYTGRPVPVDLSGFPDEMYVVCLASERGVKVEKVFIVK